MSAKNVSRSTRKTPTSQPGSSPGFEKELADLDALRDALTAGSAPDAAAVEQLRKALGHRNNFLVAKAARLIAEAEIVALLPEVLAAFDRFLINAVKSDPQCWAKNALSKTLVKLGYRSKDAYLRGMRHHQMEPVWGGQSDTAGALRGTCTHALVDCPGISDAELLAALLEPLTDGDKTVRVEAARALGQVGGVSAALLLRLRALLGKDEPEAEVLGAVYSSLLALEGTAAIPLVAAALEKGDDMAAEAALALSDMHNGEALAMLLTRFRQGADEWFSGVLLSAIALTRLPEAAEFLVALIANDSREAAKAIEAIGRAAPSADLCTRVEQAVAQADSPRLQRAMREHLAPILE